jgi:DNA polymerase V
MPPIIYWTYIQYKKDMSSPIPLQSMQPFTLDLFNSSVCAGFPSPAADHAQTRIDLNDHLLRNREATYLFRVSGDSMEGIGIYDGDTIIVDRSIEAKHNHVILAVIDDEFTLKRLYKRGKVIKLIAENPLYAPIEFKDHQEMSVWGVATFNLRKLISS